MKETHCVPKMVEVSLLEVGTVLRLEKGAWLLVEGPRQETTEYAPPPPAPRQADARQTHKSQDAWIQKRRSPNYKPISSGGRVERLNRKKKLITNFVASTRIQNKLDSEQFESTTSWIQNKLDPEQAGSRTSWIQKSYSRGPSLVRCLAR